MRFGNALGVMGDLYASAIGTTVLQLKEISPRPARFDGAIVLFDLSKGVDEATIRTALERVAGDVKSCSLGWPGAHVCFFTHEAALSAVRAAEQLLAICSGVGTLYNERSYDGRAGEEGRDDDEGRGW